MEESLPKRIAIQSIDYHRCIRCGVCAQSCPNDVIRIRKGRPVIAYREDCSQCFACLMDCAREAISIGWVRVASVD
ncbi:MAG: 4Fe-4S binding protein [Thermodesulfobacteriota bacterium]